MPTPNKTAAKKATAPRGTKERPENVNTALTVSGAEHEPANRPSSFKALKPIELVEAARAFATKDEGTPDEIIEDLAANGVSWNMYAKQFKLPGWEELPENDDEFPEPLEDWEEEEETVTTKENVITAPPQVALNEGKYLIKFIGQNWYFERGRYSFTKDNPYALMSAADAQEALVQEPTKFRQAFPAELEEYYS